jgi:Bacterial Ig domain
MKKISTATLFALLTALLIFSTVLAAITNGNFENGDWTGWTKSTGINNGYSVALGSGGSDLSAIISLPATADTHTNGVVVVPVYGSNTARVNSDQSYSTPGYGKNANVIKQQFTANLLTDGFAHVRFVYSAVMVNPVDNPHTDEQKPYFRVRVINKSKSDDVIYDFSSYVGEPGKNWQNGASFGTGGDFWQYLDWTYVDLASTALHPVDDGDIIEVEITAAGCSLGGHPGYVYVDEITDGYIAAPSISASGPATASENGPITYTYTYNNGHATDSIDPTIVITPPAGVTFTSLGDAAHCSGLNPVTCNYTGVTAGTSGNFTVTGTVNSGTAGTTIAHGNYTIAATGYPTTSGPTVFTDVLANSAPVANNDSYATKMSVMLNGSTVFTNDTDADNDTLTGTVVTPPAHALSFNFNSTNGTFTYLPETGFRGQDTFTYTVNDGTADSNVATVSIAVTPITVVLKSVAIYDGWINESSEISNVGGKINTTEKGLPVGDAINDHQWRSILHFDTASLPDNAVILSANLRVKNFNVVGDESPFTTHGNLIVDFKKGSFSGNPTMQPNDFQAPATRPSIGFLSPSTSSWYQLNISKNIYKIISLTRPVQFRLQFQLDDDDDSIQDFARFYSGNAGGKNRPRLIITYYVPPAP